MASEDIAELLKNNSRGSYFEDKYGGEFNLVDDPRVLSIASPKTNFSWFDRLFLPEKLKILGKCSTPFESGHLYVFHYPVKRLEKRIKEVCDTWKESGDEKIEPMSPEDYLKLLRGNYGDNLSCISTNILMVMNLLGRESAMQTVMDHFKQSPNNFFEVFRRLVSPSLMDHYKRKNGYLHIYDVIGKPSYLLHEVDLT